MDALPYRIATRTPLRLVRSAAADIRLRELMRETMAPIATTWL